MSRAAQALLVGGAVRIRGGVGRDLWLSGAGLPVDHQQGFWLVRGTLEPEVQEALHRNVAAGSIVLDIGSNIGYFAIISAALAGPSGHVVAFEPASDSARAVRANASLNGFSWLSVVEAAVGDEVHLEPLCLPRERSWAHLGSRGRHPETQSEQQVRVVTLDQEIASGRIPVPDVVKIDVEGSEAAVLRGFSQTLAAHDVCVICELHGTGDEVLPLMAALGYPVENLCATPGPPIAGDAHVLFRRTRRVASGAGAAV